MVFYRHFDFPQHLFGKLADARTQRVHGTRGIEVKDGHKVLVGDMGAGIDATA